MNRRLASLASVLAVASFARATLAFDGPNDERALPCRPTIACTADLVPEGAFEIETGYLHRALPHARQGSTPTLLKYTAFEWLQLQLGSNGFTRATGDVPSRYVDDVVAGAKVHFFDQRAYAPSLAASAALSVPTARGQEGYLRTYDALFIAYVTKDVGVAHLDLNLGLNVWRFEDSPLKQAWIALASSFELPLHFGVMAEGYVFSDASPVAPRDAGALLALTYSPRPWIVFDAGGDESLFPSMRTFSAFVGATFIPFVLYREPEESAHRSSAGLERAIGRRKTLVWP